jgi:hypothetical protein
MMIDIFVAFVCSARHYSVSVQHWQPTMSGRKKAPPRRLAQRERHELSWNTTNPALPEDHYCYHPPASNERTVNEEGAHPQLKSRHLNCADPAFVVDHSSTEAEIDVTEKEVVCSEESKDLAGHAILPLLPRLLPFPPAITLCSFSIRLPDGVQAPESMRCCVLHADRRFHLAWSDGQERGVVPIPASQSDIVELVSKMEDRRQQVLF